MGIKLQTASQNKKIKTWSSQKGVRGLNGILLLLSLDVMTSHKTQNTTIPKTPANTTHYLPLVHYKENNYAYIR